MLNFQSGSWHCRADLKSMQCECGSRHSQGRNYGYYLLKCSKRRKKIPKKHVVNLRVTADGQEGQGDFNVILGGGLSFVFEYAHPVLWRACLCQEKGAVCDAVSFAAEEGRVHFGQLNKARLISTLIRMQLFGNFPVKPAQLFSFHFFEFRM